MKIRAIGAIEKRSKKIVNLSILPRLALAPTPRCQSLRIILNTIIYRNNNNSTRNPDVSPREREEVDAVLEVHILSFLSHISPTNSSLPPSSSLLMHSLHLF